MKCPSGAIVIMSALLLFQCPSEAILQSLFPQLSSSVSQGWSQIRNGFSTMLGGFSGGRNRRADGGGSLFNQFPIVGNCDRIAYQGVSNCMSNFRPSNVARGQCCAWRKYRACINGLRDGIRIAARAERCPSHSFSRATVNRISDGLVGWPLSQCGSNPCGKSKQG